VVAYVTCSPHVQETNDIVAGADLIEPPTQWWPHRHGTDAMFMALFRRMPA
jgi:16S rRNA (cytosine967-C5)-methyltransferase